MASPNQCGVCDATINPYGGSVRCERCKLPCPTCGKDVSACHHALPELGDPMKRRAA